MRTLLVALTLFSANGQLGSSDLTICGQAPKICQGTWTCADATPARTSPSGGRDEYPCALDLRWMSLTGTIPTELGLYKNLGMNLLLSTNTLSGTVPTELSNWRADNCWLQESQTGPWLQGHVDSTNRWACPIEATGMCVGRGRNAQTPPAGDFVCSYYQPPSPPAPPGPPPDPSPPPPASPPPPPASSTVLIVAIAGGAAGVVAVALLGHLLYRNLTKKTPKFRADAKSTELPKSGGAKMPGELPSAQA